MSRLFTLLCLAMFTLTMPACDDEGPHDTSASTSESSSGDDSSGDSSSTDKPDDLAPGDGTSGTTGSDENPGTATLATPHIYNNPEPTH